MVELMKCRLCGGELRSFTDSEYRCEYCGSAFAKKTEESLKDALKSALGEEKFERVSAARQNLWAAMHAEYTDSSSCVTYARELKSLVPQDYYANFAETANGQSDAALSAFLGSSSESDVAVYADAVLDFMLKSLTPGTLTAVCGYIDRAFPKTSPEYARYIDIYETEAEKVESGIYETTIPRDVFLAYSGADTPKALELCDFLESQGMTCFVSMRNLRHGRGAVDNYDRALQSAMDNCKVFVFLSSKNSRNLGCDAMRKEIPYVRKKDLENAPAEYRNLSYEKLPSRYKKSRVEYLADDYAGTAADKVVKQFFDGIEWCKTKEDVADRVVTYLTFAPETEPETRSGSIRDEDIQKIISAVSVDKGAAVSGPEREKNVLEHAKRLVLIEDFDEAGKILSGLEQDEITRRGYCDAAVYYYKILASHGVTSGDALYEKLSESLTDLKGDKDFRLLKCCDDCAEKTAAVEIEERLESARAESERKAREEEERLRREEEEKRLREEEEKRQRRLEEEEKRLRAEEEEKQKRREEEERKSKLEADERDRRREEQDRKRREAEERRKNETTQGLGFMPSGTGVIVTGIGTCTDRNLVIPSVYDGRPVTGFKAEAFMGCAQIVSVTIPNGVTSVPDRVFGGCKELRSVIVPNSVTQIGKWTFSACESLESVVIGGGVSSIGDYAFFGCKSLSGVFYFGAKDGWRSISIGSNNQVLRKVPIYCYSRTKPSGSGTYWHYGPNGVIEFW